MLTEEQVAFYNEHGYVHDMMAVRRVSSRWAAAEGAPVAEHSWFPGWAWQILSCACCGEHLGWRFSAAEPGLSPRVFYGLRRSQVSQSSWRAGEAGAGGGLPGRGRDAAPAGDGLD